MNRMIAWIAVLVLSSFSISLAESNPRVSRTDEENYFM